jgi:hypothetical protein
MMKENKILESILWKPIEVISDASELFYMRHFQSFIRY